MTTNVIEQQTEQQTAIIVYTQPNCQQCRATFRMMDKKGLQYTVVDVTEDKAAADYVKGLGHLQAPVVVTSEGISWAGFDPDKIAAIQ